MKDCQSKLDDAISAYEKAWDWGCGSWSTEQAAEKLENLYGECEEENDKDSWTKNLKKLAEDGFLSETKRIKIYNLLRKKDDSSQDSYKKKRDQLINQRKNRRWGAAGLFVVAVVPWANQFVPAIMGDSLPTSVTITTITTALLVDVLNALLYYQGVKMLGRDEKTKRNIKIGQTKNRQVAEQAEDNDKTEIHFKGNVKGETVKDIISKIKPKPASATELQNFLPKDGELIDIDLQYKHEDNTNVKKGGKRIGGFTLSVDGDVE